MLHRVFALSAVAFSIVLNGCTSGAGLATNSQLPAGAGAQSVARTSPAGNSLFWKPFFQTVAYGRTKTVRLVYSPASLEFEVDRTHCSPAIVTVTKTASGHKRGHEYYVYTVKPVTNEAYTCDVYATAPHAQIRSTLQITVKKAAS